MFSNFISAVRASEKPDMIGKIKQININKVLLIVVEESGCVEMAGSIFSITDVTLASLAAHTVLITQCYK